MISTEIHCLFLHQTRPPEAISVIPGSPLVFLDKYSHLRILTCVWAHTTTHVSPPAPSVEIGNYEKLSLIHLPVSGLGLLKLESSKGSIPAGEKPQ